SKKTIKYDETPAKAPHSATSDSDSDAYDAEPVFAKRSVNTPDQAFEDIYLRQAAKEFANGLNKLTTADDYNATKNCAIA
ncbi:hypothetical protein LTR17_027835, partial [Elasticomyces elasticus]